MKILYISTSMIPSRTANSIHVMKMCSAFAKHGHDVHLICAENKNETEKINESFYSFYGVSNNFHIVRFHWGVMKGKSYLYALKTLGTVLINKIKLKNFDLCYGRFLFGCFLVATMGYPTILEIHDPPPEKRNFGKWVFERLISRRNFISLVVISKNLKRRYLLQYPLLQDKIIVAHDGADEDANNNVLNWEKSSSQFHVGYIGHLYKGRGMPLLVEVANKLPWVTMHIIGGTKKDIQYWKGKTKGVKNIVFHGFVEPSKTSLYRRSCDVLVAPYEETVSIHGVSTNTAEWMSPLKIFEYMSSGVPIICSKLPALEEIVTDKETAFLCKPDSGTEWISTITYLKENPIIAKTIAENALKEFTNKYTWEKRATHVLLQHETNNYSK